MKMYIHNYFKKILDKIFTTKVLIQNLDPE